MLAENFTEQSAPRSLEAWCALAIDASFPTDQKLEMYVNALEYVDWLNTLPVKENNA